MVEKALQVAGETLEKSSTLASMGAVDWVFFTAFPAVMETVLRYAAQLEELREEVEALEVEGEETALRNAEKLLELPERVAALEAVVHALEEDLRTAEPESPPPQS